MMKTIRWFKITVPQKKIELLGKSLLALPFSEETGEGFSMERITSSTISGKYIRSKPFIKEVTTPSGGIDTIKGTDYSIIDFKLSLGEIQILEIYSKPRTIKPLVDMISSIIGIGFSIEKIKIDLIDFIPIVEASLGRTKITKMAITDLNIQDKALGQLTLTSDQDIRKVIENQITLGRSYKITYIKACFETGPYYGGCLELNSLSSLTSHNLPYKKFMKQYMDIYTKYLSTCKLYM